MISAFHHRYDLVTLEATTEKIGGSITLYQTFPSWYFLRRSRRRVAVEERCIFKNTVISSYEITDAVHVMQEADEHVIINVLKTEQFVGHFYRAPWSRCSFSFSVLKMHFGKKISPDKCGSSGAGAL